MYRTDDPVADFHRHDREQEAWLKKLPVCCNCRKPIQTEQLFDIEGDLYCEECGESLFKRNAEGYTVREW